MAMYKICPQCGKHVEYGKQCECLDKYNKERYKAYKNRRNDKKEQSFYSGQAWRKCSKNIRTHYFGLCIYCWYRNKHNNDEINYSSLTHHIVEIKEDWHKRLQTDNLTPLCDECHSKIHTLYDKNEQTKINTQELLRIIKNEFENDYY